MAACRRIVALLADYLDDRLPETERAALRKHLDGCPACDDYLASYRDTVELLRSLSEEDLPTTLRLRLRAFLDERSSN